MSFFTLLVVIWNYAALKNLLRQSTGFSPSNNLLNLFFLAVVSTVSGYLPFTLIYTPAIDFFTSRVNIFALPGASVLIAVLIWGLARFAKRPQIQWINLTFLLLILVATGSLFQFEVQVETHRVWCDQANIWAQLKNLAPAFTNDTYIGIVMKQSHYGESQLKRDIIITPWEADAAVRLLYNNPTLNGSVVYLNRPDITHLAKDGITISWPPRIEHYSSAVLFFYDENLRQLMLVKDPSELNIVDPPNYSPEKHILPGTFDNTPYISLISQCVY